MLCLQYCAHNFLSESALEAIEAGRAEFAATLVGMGLLPASFQSWGQQQSKSGTTPGEAEPHEFDAYCNNARIIKAALCAGMLCNTWQLDTLSTLCELPTQLNVVCLLLQIILHGWGLQTDFADAGPCSAPHTALAYLQACYDSCCAVLCHAVPGCVL